MVYCQKCGAQVTGDVCQNCGQAIIFPQTQYQQQVPQPYYQQPMPPPYYPPPGPPPSYNMVGVVIVVVLIVLFLAFIAVSIIFASNNLGSVETTPRGALQFSDDPNVSGRYTGMFQGSVELEKIDISLFDASQGQTDVEEQPESGTVLSIAGGCELTYTDTNSNDRMDATDSLILEGGGPGDRITFVYRSTGETVATDIIN